MIERHDVVRKRVDILVKWLTGAVVLLATAVACSKPPQIDFYVTGQKYMNGGGYAALVCIYQLRSDTNFRGLQRELFWREGQKTLQSDIVGTRTDVMLAPNEIRVLTIVLSEETNFIGAAADLRKPEGDLWRQVYPLGPRIESTIEIVVGMGGIELKY